MLIIHQIFEGLTPFEVGNLIGITTNPLLIYIGTIWHRNLLLSFVHLGILSKSHANTHIFSGEKDTLEINTHSFWCTCTYLFAFFFFFNIFFILFLLVLMCVDENCPKQALIMVQFNSHAIYALTNALLLRGRQTE